MSSKKKPVLEYLEVEIFNATYNRLLDRAYKIGSREAFISFKKGRRFARDMLIVNPDYHELAQEMETGMKDLRLKIERLERELSEKPCVSGGSGNATNPMVKPKPEIAGNA